MFSPDGRWITYFSTETGHEEVYVRPFRGPGGKWQVSAGAGRFPFWSRSGHEILFIGADRGLWSADVKWAGPGFEAGSPRRLLAAADADDLIAIPDDSRFLMARRSTQAPPPSLIVVLNWLAGLRK